MTAEQIALLRDFNNKDDGSGHRLAGSLSVIFNNEVAFSDTRDFVVYDDENELVHSIRANSEGPVEQAYFPFRIMTGYYGNAQYMEALYDMANFQKAVDGLLLDTGLINQAQRDQIIKWSKGIRNNTIVPKQPGPYFKDTVLPVGSTPVAEVRDDGLHHGVATNLISYQDKIHNYIRPAIESSILIPKKLNLDKYDIHVGDTSIIPMEIQRIIEAFPKEDLYEAVFTDTKKNALYKPNVTEARFAANTAILFKDLKPGKTKVFLLYIEAYNTRTSYTFNITFDEDKEEDPSVFINKTKEDINAFVDSFESTCDATISRTGTRIQATISNTNIGDDVDQFLDLLNTLQGIEKVVYKTGSTSITLNNIGDTDSIEEFKKGVINTMPTDNNDAVVTGSVEAESSTGASVVYTLKVKYYNQSECPCSIGDNYYITLAEAVAVGGVVTLQNDVTESIIIPEGVSVELALNGHTLTNVDGSDTIVNNGELTISGEGTIDNVSHQKAVLVNNGTANVLGGTLTRSQETGVNATTSGGNSFYVIQNHGSLVIGAEGEENDGISVSADGKFSSLITNGWADTKDKSADSDTCYMVINGGTFAGGINTIKNDELGVMTINGGTFINYAQNSLLNWHICTINDGSFTADGLVVICNGTYGLGVGDLTITGGEFNSGSSATVGLVGDYPSTDIKISGGTFSSDPSKYVVSGFAATEVDGKFVVSPKSAEEQIDDIIANLPTDSGMTIEEDEEAENTYSIVTSTGSVSESGLFDSIAAITTLTSIEVTDGETTLTYNAGEDLDAFKASVDELLPKSNTDAEVTLTMKVTA